MALVTNNWYTVTFAPLTDPPWSAGAAPTIVGHIVDRILLGTLTYVFCVDDSVMGGAYAQIAYYAGTSFGMTTLPKAVMTIVGTPTMDTTTMDDGNVLYSIRDSATAWVYYDTNANAVRKLSAPATLGAFLS